MEKELNESLEVYPIFFKLQNWKLEKIEELRQDDKIFDIDLDTLEDLPNTLKELSKISKTAEEKLKNRSSEIKGIQEEIQILQDELEIIQTDRSFDSLLPPFSQDYVEYLKSFRENLISLRLENQFKIQKMTLELNSLWESLKKEDDYRSDFLDKNIGVSTKLIEKYEQELVSLKLKKQKQDRKSLLNQRDKIRELWDHLNTPELQRRLFEDKFDYTETIISKSTIQDHENLYSELVSQVSQFNPIKDLINTRQELVLKKNELENIKADFNRYNNRHYGQKGFKKEQKMADEIKSLPSINLKLKELLKKWKVDNQGESLLVDGIDYLEIINEDLNKQNRAPGSVKKISKPLKTPQK